MSRNRKHQPSPPMCLHGHEGCVKHEPWHCRFGHPQCIVHEGVLIPEKKS